MNLDVCFCFSLNMTFDSELIETCDLVFFLRLQQHTDKLNTQVALHQLYQYASKYYDVVSKHSFMSKLLRIDSFKKK